MSINNALSVSMPPIPYGGIPGFDKIPSGVMGYIGEYVGCLAEGDQPSWSVDRHHEYFRVLFAPRLNPVRLGRIAQANNELNTEYASYQNYKRIEDCWRINKWLLSNHFFSSELDMVIHGGDLQNIANDRIFYSSPTFRQYWFTYLSSLHLAHLSYGVPNANADGPYRYPLSADLRILIIQSACDVLDQENNGARVVFPTQRLRAMIQSTQETFNEDIASCEAQGARNVRSRSIFKKVLACVVAVCLIARRILSQVVPMKCCQYIFVFSAGFLLRGVVEVLTGNISVNLLRLIIARAFPRGIAGTIAAFHLVFHGIGISKVGLARVWEVRKENFKAMIAHIQDIWSSRELITDVYLEGAAAHASIARESIRQLGPIQGLRHGFRVLSRIARQELA